MKLSVNICIHNGNVNFQKCKFSQPLKISRTHKHTWWINYNHLGIGDRDDSGGVVMLSTFIFHRHLYITIRLMTSLCRPVTVVL